MADIVQTQPVNAPGYFRTWFQPRSTDRDEAFRERIIRIALAMMLTGSLLFFLAQVLFFRSPWSIISYPTTGLYEFLLCLGSAYAVGRKRFVTAGLLLTLGTLGLLVMSIVVDLQQLRTMGIIATTAFLLIPLITTLVLPRRYVPWLTGLTAVTFGLLQVATDPTDALGNFIPMTLVLSLAGALLYQFRTEFDARLSALTVSLDEASIARDEAESARHRAENADRAKSQFLANMSHELRTPLNAIIGYDEAMLGGMVGEFQPKQHQLLGHIQYNSRRLLGLINDVLDLSKIESGSLKVFAAPMSPQQVVTRTIESVKSLAQEKNLALEVKVADDAPALVLSDEKKIEQVVINLVGNAIKFTTTGGVYVDVRSLNPKQWQILVRDTGIGIPREKQTDIFEPFQQVDNSSTRKFKGTGLGLSISKRMVEIMNGTIEVTSDIGKGTTFTVTLPRTIVEEQSLESQMKQAKSQAEHPVV
jgi:signal transduction histidine kinase